MHGGKLKSHKMKKKHGTKEMGEWENISLQADKVQSRTLPSFHGIVTTQKPDRFLSSFKKGSILIRFFISVCTFSEFYYYHKFFKYKCPRFKPTFFCNMRLKKYNNVQEVDLFFI